MKKPIFIISIIFLINFQPAYSQEGDPVKYIFKNSTELKGFGTIDMKLSNIVDDTGLLVGATGGVTVNKYLLFGLGGYGIATKTTVQGIDPNKQLRLYGGYGGLLLGFNLFPRQVVHLSFPVLIGAGSIDLEDETFFSNSYDENFTIERSAFFVAEPGVLLEINITNFFHVGIGASYRFVDGLSMANLTSEDLSDWSGNLVFKFGSF